MEKEMLVSREQSTLRGQLQNCWLPAVEYSIFVDSNFRCCSRYTLFKIRVCLWLYVFIVNIASLGTDYDENYFAYFSNLSFLGLGLYFFIAIVISGVYWQPKFLVKVINTSWFRNLHHLLYATIITFPFIIIPMYWWQLSDSAPSNYVGIWINLSIHGLNLVIISIEFFFNKIPLTPFQMVPIIGVVICYIFVVWINNAITGHWVYEFLALSGMNWWYIILFGVLVLTFYICYALHRIKDFVWHMYCEHSVENHELV